MKKMRVLVWIFAIAFVFAFVHAPPMQADTNELNDETMIVPTTTMAPQIAAQRVPQPADSPPNFLFAEISVTRGTPNVYHWAIWADNPPSTSTSSRQYVGRLPNARARPANNYVGGRANHLVLKV